MTLLSFRNHKKTLQIGLLAIIILAFSNANGATRHIDASKAPLIHHLTVLFTNDVHGHPVKFSNLSVPEVGGLPARATLVKEIRNTNENVLLLDAGDLNTGQSVSNFFKAEPDILGYNFMGYDAMVLGNHEIDHPVDILKEQMNLAKFPFLSANVKTRQGAPLAIPYIIKQFNGFKVAIFGLTTTETKVTGNPDHIKDLIFEDEIKVAKQLVPYLRKRADVVIALTHLGIYEGLNRGSKRLASQVTGIDLIVDGNTDTKLETPLIIPGPDSNHQTLIVQAWHWGLVLGKIDLWVQDKKIVDFHMEVIPINLKRVVKGSNGKKTFPYIGKPIKEDPQLLALLQPYADKVDRLLDETVGHAKGVFENDHGRYRETALGDLVADAMRWYLRRFNPDFALTNSGAIRAGIPEGSVTRESVYNSLPFDSSLVLLKLTGAQLETLFDFIGTIKPGEGAFPQVSDGIRFTLNPKKKTCENILINGQPIDPNKSYRIVTNSYLAKGGDGYTPFTKTIDRFDSSIFQRDALIAYIEHLGGKLVPKVKGRIKFAP
ncbi:MAG: 5'-nucleotidase C-terminal domain-containing protein [Deltaproteobacteria bacterium]|nr:5'-nucleotidase C-terminal domain-containing protein [Deltaproteobacteria bacterium]